MPTAADLLARLFARLLEAGAATDTAGDRAWALCAGAEAAALLRCFC